MEKLIRFINQISQVFGFISGIFIIFSAALVILEIIFRNFFNSTLYITYEYTGYFMVAITFFGLAYTLKENGHIRLTFLHKFIKVGKPREILEIFTHCVGLILFIIITYNTAMYFWDSVVSRSQSMQISRTYLAIPQAVMPIGSFLVSLQFIAGILTSIINIRTGRFVQDDIETEYLGR